MPLRWNQLLLTAKNDLKIRDSNRQVRQQRANFARAGASEAAAGKLRQSGFLPKHVRHARLPSDILRAAMRDAADVVRQPLLAATIKVLYEDFEELRRAYEAARETEIAELAERVWENAVDLREHLKTQENQDDLLRVGLQMLFRTGAFPESGHLIAGRIVATPKMSDSDMTDAHRILLMFENHLPIELRERVNRLSMTAGPHAHASA